MFQRFERKIMTILRTTSCALSAEANDTKQTNHNDTSNKLKTAGHKVGNVVVASDVKQPACQYRGRQYMYLFINIILHCNCTIMCLNRSGKHSKSIRTQKLVGTLVQKNQDGDGNGSAPANGVTSRQLIPMKTPSRA